MAGEQELSDVEANTPLMALSAATTLLIANALNKKKVLPAENGKPRDWRGLVDLTGVSDPSGNDPTSQILTGWKRNTSSRPTLGLLVDYLRLLDRRDVSDDCFHRIREDAQQFNSMPFRTSISNEERDRNIQRQILTYDDNVMLHRGEPLRTYDALLLYADEDQDIVDDMMNRLHSSLQLCRKDDLMGGLLLEHHGVMRLIKERCRHVIVIITQNLLKSPMNQFLIAFAHLKAIETETRIIIPCMYANNLNLPDNLLHMIKLNMTLHISWERLNMAMGVLCPQTSTRQQTVYETPAIMPAPLQIRELSTSQSGLELSRPQKKSTSQMNYTPRENNNKEDQSKLDEIRQSSSSISALSCSSLLPSENKATETTSKIIEIVKKTLGVLKKKRVAEKC